MDFLNQNTHGKSKESLEFFMVLLCFSAWILGTFMCKAVAYVQGVSVCASAYSLAAISFDRQVNTCFIFFVQSIHWGDAVNSYFYHHQF